MSSITQTIPNYINGISQQPDELKPPGYVTVAKNVLPDVTEGLVKRPGSKLMKTITPYTEASTWFDYYRDENEHYIGQIQKWNGAIKIWNCKDGTEKTVIHNVPQSQWGGQHWSRAANGIVTITTKTNTLDGNGTDREHKLSVGDVIFFNETFALAALQNEYAAGRSFVVTEVPSKTTFKIQTTNLTTGSGIVGWIIKEYLMFLEDDDIQTLTLNDYTYICNRRTIVRLDDEKSAAKPFEAYIDLKKIAYARQYGINLFDDTTTDKTIKTATRISVPSSNLDSDSTCPNVGTEIFNVGTEDDIQQDIKQVIQFTKIHGYHQGGSNFFETDLTLNYKLHYCPPEWTTNTFYRPGDLVTGRPDAGNNDAHQSVYQLKAGSTARKTTTSESIPSHQSGDGSTVNGHTWTHVSDTIYTANSNTFTGSQTSQTYHGKPCLTLSDSRNVISEATLDDLIAAWKNTTSNPEYAYLPFILDDQQVWNSGTTQTTEAEFGIIWKHFGYYDNHIDRIILERPGGTDGGQTIGGSNSDLITGVGEIKIKTGGWSTDVALGPGRSDLYFRLTTTGQAIPDSTGDNYSCRYTTTVDLLHGGDGWEVGDRIRVRLKNGLHVIQIDKTSIGKVQANLGLIRPTPTSFDAQTTVTSDSIIGDIRQAIIDSQTVTYAQNNGSGSAGVRITITKAKHNLETGDKVDVEFLTKSGGNIPGNETAKAITVSDADTFYFDTAAGDENITGTCIVDFTNANLKQIGGGLYLKRPSRSFKISTPATDILNVMTTEVDDVADLPNQCKHGYVVKVKNSESDQDDYYVKFIGQLKKDGDAANDDDYLDGDGTWEECLGPEQQFKFDISTMPYQLVRRADGIFEIKQIPMAAENIEDHLPQWEAAKVGTTGVDGTNPQPSFVGKTINNMLFWRNRLIMLSDENVIMSKPGDFFNFWYKSAIAFSDIDPIDISCSSEYPAIIYAGIQTNAGLVLFTKNQQFLVGTDTDILSTTTAKINSLSSYNFNHSTNPFSLGTTIGFLDNAGKYNRLWEMSTVLREGQPTVVEQSKSVNELIDTDLNLVANSRENQLAFFSKRNSNKIFGFRYHTVGQKRIQQAWVTWEVHGEIQHMAMFDDALFLVIKDKDVYSIQRIALTTLSDSIEITDDRGTTSDTSDDLTYRVYLDNGTVIPAASLGYSSSSGRTGFTIPTNFDATSTNKLAVFCHSAGDDNGRYTDQVSIVGTGANANIEFPGDWTGQDLTVGYLYDMEVQLPTIYVQQAVGESFKAEIHKSLVIHRVKLSLGPSGLYTTTLARPGKTDFTKTHEAPLADQYNASRVSVNNVLKETVPVYEKNTNLTLTIKSTHPTPATLFSMAWEGDYTDKFYQSV